MPVPDLVRDDGPGIQEVKNPTRQIPPSSNTNNWIPVEDPVFIGAFAGMTPL
jgi:hypothetical protein